MGDSGTVSHADYKTFVKESFLRNIALFSRDDRPYTIEVFSDEFFQAWAAAEPRRDVLGREVALGGPISFCYIDGNHSYEFCAARFREL